MKTAKRAAVVGSIAPAAAPQPDAVTTFTGRRVDPINPRPEDISITDIAHHLSMQVRWTGAVSTFYSTAQHSILVSYACHPDDALWGLLHDAAEAYLSDVNRPVKHLDALAGYRDIEDQVLGVILARFGLSGPMPESVKRADDLLLETERRDLLPPGDVDLAKCAPWSIRPMPPAEAEQAFLKRFKALIRDGEASDVSPRTRVAGV